MRSISRRVFLCYFFATGVFIFAFSAFKSICILSKIERNCGLLFCMRLLEAKAMSSASFSIWSSASVYMWFLALLSRPVETVICCNTIYEDSQLCRVVNGKLRADIDDPANDN